MKSQSRLRFALPALGGIAAVAVVAAAGPAAAAQPQVGLGTASSYAILAGSTITNTGPSTISGNVGVSPGTATPGLTSAMVSNGVLHKADAAALQAKKDLVTAYNDAAGRSPEVDKTGQDLGGQTLIPGVYDASSAMALTGTVTLDAQGDPDAVFVFQAGSTLVTASGSRVNLIGGAQPCHVFWQVGSSATIGTTTRFVGSVLALTSITLKTSATVQGRMLARNGQVALDTNTINRPVCDAPVQPSSSASASASSSASASASATPLLNFGHNGPGKGATGGNGGNNGGGNETGGGESTGGGTTGGGTGGPTIPVGHPDTGRASETGTPTLLVAGLACLTGAAVAGGAALRGPRRKHAGRHT